MCCDSNMAFSENDYFRFVAYYLYFHNDLSLSLGLKQLVQIYLWSLNVTAVQKFIDMFVWFSCKFVSAMQFLLIRRW